MLKRIATASIVVALVASGAAFVATRSRGTVVTLHKTSLGRVLATSKGRTLYVYTLDGRNKSRCGSSCVPYWPPLLTTGKPVARPGVHKSLLGRARRSNGTFQVTYNGHPLYRYVGDSNVGQTNGEGLQTHWFVVSASGKRR
jgi:predicted lipoprotein with Yx(FWY)xxD motif